MLFSPYAVYDVRISEHAVKRIEQRFRLFIPHEDYKRAIHQNFRKSVLDKRYVFSPTMKHKLELAHGIGSFRSETEQLVFAGKYIPEKNRVVINTVWKKEGCNVRTVFS